MNRNLVGTQRLPAVPDVRKFPRHPVPSGTQLLKFLRFPVASDTQDFEILMGTAHAEEMSKLPWIKTFRFLNC